MDRAELLSFLRRHRYCVQASVKADGAPQAAVVGFAVTNELEIVFDTLGSTRKAYNLRLEPRIALVIGWDDEQTVQLEGAADEPSGPELARLKQAYFGVFPDGVARQSWPSISYFRVRPHWARYSDFRPGGSISELNEQALRAR